MIARKEADPAERQREIREGKGQSKRKDFISSENQPGDYSCFCPHSICCTEIRDTKRIGLDIFGNVKDRRKSSLSWRLREERL